MPPISVISRVVNKMMVDRARGILVVPQWNSAVFWPLLCPNGHFIPEILDVIHLPSDRRFYVPCQSEKCMFGNVNLKFDMLACYMDFRK